MDMSCSIRESMDMSCSIRESMDMSCSIRESMDMNGYELLILYTQSCYRPGLHNIEPGQEAVMPSNRASQGQMDVML